ncbi:MAG: SRPBCC family protein [Prolixibacteraceae bacterium]|jgi:ligand-binding SRPBCC domain-containing protein|nr:SRPBCC family protein [Prolixibacteraceae bacterium]
MGFYQFKKEQYFNSSIDELWDFISNPHNLKIITPKYMGFDITSEGLPVEMYEGMIISYKVSPLLGIKTTWVTEITRIKEKEYFVDEQRVGPYKIWHHQHFLESTPKGTLMKDIVSYQPPLFFLGDVANKLIIKKKLEEIFVFRTKALNDLF